MHLQSAAGWEVAFSECNSLVYAAAMAVATLSKEHSVVLEGQGCQGSLRVCLTSGIYKLR